MKPIAHRYPYLFAALLGAGLAAPALAHHGVASLGAASLDGPGAPVETSSSAMLSQGQWLGYLKLDHAEFETYAADPANPETDYNQYWMLGLGYGFTPWLSGYLFQPYHNKQDERGGLDSRGFADVSVIGVLGFKYDGGLRLTPASESLDDLMDWHFTVYAGSTLPSGDANHRLSDGSIDPGKALGFGKASYIYGATATRQFSERGTAVLELGRIQFQRYRYDDGQTMKFGSETRVNGALAYRLKTLPESRFRLDANVEANYLKLGRDVADGVPESATGGEMIYAVAGVRLYKDNTSLGLALKKPVWTDLNEEDDQQGAEGKERYRFIATFSVLF